MPTPRWPKNPHIRNGKLAALYVRCLRRGWRIPGKLLGQVLNCQINSPVPERLFLPHPTGIVVDTCCEIGEDVVLLQQVTLGGRDPYHRPERAGQRIDPILEEGVYVGPGARILGPVRIGAWSLIGANAVITTDLPPYSIAVGHNRILERKTTDL